MVNNIDDWLNSLGLDEEPQHPIETSIIQAPELPAEPQQPAPQELSENDFDDILQGLGFNEVQEAEIVEDTEEEEDEGESRVLDVEEDESPVERAIRELDEDIALEAVRSVNDENYPDHNPDEETSNDAEALQMEYIANRIVAAGSNPYSTRVLNIPAPTEELNSEPAPPAPVPLIEPNSPTLLMNDATSRFSGTEWFNEIQKQKVIIAGMGGIGSNLAFQVARMNPEAMFLYDNDTVETVNMSGQLFSRNDIGRTKVDAVAEKISSFTTTQHVYALNERYTPVSERGDIMMCGFDNMAARRVFFDAWLGYLESKSEEEKKKCLYLDGIINCFNYNL